MNEEIQSIENNNTWELTILPIGKKPIGVKWVYKTKYKLDGNVDWFKARGHKQKLGIDYFEFFAPIARLNTVCMIIALAAQKKVETSQNGLEVSFS